MTYTNVLEGIAVIIDDEVKNDNTIIYNLVQQIEGRGIPCVKYEELPGDKEVSNFKGISFVILDWYLQGDLPLSVRADKVVERNLLDFVEMIKKTIFAPIFIFSQQDTDSIKEKLAKRSLVHEGRDSIIFVGSKSEFTGDRLFQRISNWIKDSPTVYVVKEWEKEQKKTANEVFIEFYSLHKSWPYVLWKTFMADKVNPSRELGEVLTKNIHSRMAPFEFEDSIIGRDVGKISADEIRKVLEGERFVSNDNLHKDSIALGDVFKKGGKIYINVRPDCDCIEGRGIDGNASIDDVELYLIKGSKLNRVKETESYDSEFGQMIENSAKTIIFNMFEGSSYDFRFKDLKILPWRELKNKRIGRLLPPYITRLHQRYAYYLHRPGIPRIPAEAFAPKVDEPASEA